MEIAVTSETDISIFAIKGRLDAVTVPELEQQLNQWFEGTGKKLIFDLEGLDYISSAGLRTFLSTAKKMKARDGKLCMTRLRDNVKDVFTISGFIALIPAFDTLGAAQDSMR
ncbi:MAG: anti-sigma factor antagonist [Deltaproteobacteria bacterium HGW-Deltaproteobacteria-1]|jgi:anti-anti-sigma factor|nr:MAG: anti-sigma factor antagonist [Deltaproteobacteria bacterium HGW-Deltaproteobacteria-1]